MFKYEVGRQLYYGITDEWVKVKSRRVDRSGENLYVAVGDDGEPFTESEPYLHETDYDGRSAPAVQVA